MLNFLSKEHPAPLEYYALNPSRLGNRAIIIKNLLSPSECERFVDYIDATEMIPGSSKKAVRDNYVSAVEDEALARVLFQRSTAAIEGLQEDTIECNSENGLNFLDSGCGMKGIWKLHSLHPTMEIVKYFTGGHFGAHFDGDTVLDAPTLRTFKTFMVYLNDNYDGGTTNFGDYEDTSDTNPHISEALCHTSFKARQGDCIIFDHKLWHEGQSVTSGHKYLMKTNILYHNQICESGLSSEALAARLYYEGVEQDKQGCNDNAIAKYRRAYKLYPPLEQYLF